MTAPPGFATVTPYFMLRDVASFARFLVEGLGGEEVGRTLRPDGKIANLQVRIGNGTIMAGECQGEPMPASYYLYVDDAAIARAIAAGAVKTMDVADMPYRDRQGGVRDPHGNLWWISQRLDEGGYV